MPFWKTALKKFTKGAEQGADNGNRRPSFFRISLEERMLLVKRLAILLKAGVPILECLKMMKNQTSSKSTGFVLNQLADSVEQGQALHFVLSQYRKNFGDFTINMIKVGEISGTLHENLNYLADELKKQKELRRKVISALVYPIFIVLATIGITLLLMLYVFPKILPVFQSFSTDLPLPTRMLIFLSHNLAQWGWLILLILGGLAALFTYFVRKNIKFALLVDKFLLKIPVLGKLFQFYHLANFCRTLGVLIRSDVRIVEAASITAKTATNLVYKNNLSELIGIISTGGKISEHFELSPKLYPAMVSQMITVGENTGKLSDSLLYLADIYESEVDELTKNLSTAIEPLLMIFMGVLVGFVAISIITPIYSITRNLHP